MENKGLMFPDELFEIHNYEHYKGLVSNGCSLAKNKRILFTGICRNVGENLERNILRILFISKFFKDSKIFIYENDSDDQTVEILKKYSGSHLHYISTNREDSNYIDLLEQGKDRDQYNRCKTLASCRNEYIKFIESNSGKFDYVCVIDLDIWGGWSYNGFLHSLSVLEDKKENGAVTSYGVLSHNKNEKDLEEVSPDKYIMYDCFVFRPIGIESQPIETIPSYNFIRQNPGDNPIVVNSNFNGLGLYKIDAILGNKYDAHHEDGCCVDADHVILHREMRKKGWNVIFNPSMLVSYAHHKYSRIPLIK